jgi:hypothetical protein
MKTNQKKRKAMNYKKIVNISVILFLFSSLQSQSISETRNFIKTFPVGKETSFEVINKYGTIQITSWNKDSAYVRAEVRAYAQNQSKVNKMFDGISINFSDTKYLVRAQTEFTQSINMLFEGFKGMTSKLINYDSRVEINYFINIPEYLNLNIENKYGNIYMENSTGELNVSMNNGSFKANSLSRKSSLTIAFCDANINSIASGKIDGSFSEFTIGEAGDLNVNSISCKYDIKHSGSIQLESRKDKFFLGNIDILQGKSYFSDFRLASLRKELNLTTRYGSVNADLIEKGFESVDINSGYSDISLSFDQNASYNLDIRHQNAFLILPDKNIKKEEKSLNEDKKEYDTYGVVGRNPGATKVKIDATHGNIYIK